MTDRELMSAAKEASLNAYIPYSHFAVGAALECDDGTIYTGCNVENAALGSTICAERTACCKAVSEGHRKFRRIAIYADSQNWCTPCGACRQLSCRRIFNRNQQYLQFRYYTVQQTLPGRGYSLSCTLRLPRRRNGNARILPLHA